MEPGAEPAEEDEDWSRPQSARKSKSSSARSRVIVHLDLDCFYAQVEMIRAPDLRDKPLGVQQKSIVVTCNYEARKHGVKKLMSLKEAKEKCPHLVLVNGEDLTPYREMSYKVTELLGEYCPLVERLGFDENFMDITEVVEERLKHLQQSGGSGTHVSGHVYKDQAINLHDTTHLSLVVGSQVAEALREALNSKLGLTSCAGVASNKLLAKLVSGTFKPNQQTLLLPESSQELLSSLDHIQKVPGIGYKTSKRLETLGVKTVVDLQRFPSAALEKELGLSLAQRLQKLSYGEDEAPVTPSGPPQSFSDEDSFKKCSSEVEVQEKLEELLPSLLHRIHRDGRQPHTIRLTIRRFSSSERWLHRECRQCPIPPHLLPKFGKDTRSLISPLVTILMKLLRKMIDVELPFHLTLLNICFSNLKELPSNKKGSIGFYLKPMVPPSGPGGQEAEEVPQGEGSAACNQTFGIGSSAIPKPWKLSERQASPMRKRGIPDFPVPSFPAAIDAEVFRELPEAIQQELLSARPEFHAGNGLDEPYVSIPKETPSFSPNPEGLSRATHSKGCSKRVAAPQGSVVALGPNSEAAASSEYPGKSEPSTEKEPLEVGMSQTGLCGSNWEQATPPPAQPRSREVVFPPHVDTKTFYELPADVQQDLLAEWKSREDGPKPMDKPLEKPRGRKGRGKAAPCASNSLWRYFKPQGKGL